MRRLLPPSSPPRFVNLVGGRGQAILPCRLGFPGQSPSPEAHVAAVRGLPSFSEVGHAGALRGFRGSHCGGRWSAGQLVMDLGVCEAAQWCCCSGGDASPSWSSSIFFCEGRKTVDKRAWRGKRGWSGGEERAAVRARGRRGKDPKEHERSDVGVSTPRFPQALNSPVPPVWTSWGGGAPPIAPY